MVEKRCIQCGFIKKHKARGMCEKCYRSWHYQNNKTEYNEYARKYYQKHHNTRNKQIAKLAKQKKEPVEKKCPCCLKFILVDRNANIMFCPMCGIQLNISRTLSNNPKTGRKHGILLKKADDSTGIITKKCPHCNKFTHIKRSMKEAHCIQCGQKFSISEGKDKSKKNKVELIK